ncbi:hypothetical protein H311_03427 [Anncaliia algerae PRA109]|nr:hypothetical protein H311_03427 [Anncaliia algerae PRA109]
MKCYYINLNLKIILPLFMARILSLWYVILLINVLRIRCSYQQTPTNPLLCTITASPISYVPPVSNSSIGLSFQQQNYRTNYTETQQLIDHNTHRNYHTIISDPFM